MFWIPFYHIWMNHTPDNRARQRRYRLATTHSSARHQHSNYSVDSISIPDSPRKHKFKVR